MFGLSALELKLAALASILTVALVTFIGFGWHERHVGAQGCVQADIKATEVQDKKDAQTLQKDQVAVKDEGATYEQTIAAPPPVGPPVRLCKQANPPRVQAAAAAGPKADAAPAVSAEAGGDTQAPDIGPDLRENVRQADAQVAGLEAYIRDVCLAR